MAKRNVIPKKRIQIVVILVLGIMFFLLTFFQAKKLIFRQCVEHVDNSPTHTHTQLKIVQEGVEIPIPSNVGLTDACMHPLHTHDRTGLIHMEYPLPIPFFLGDFFDVMGTTFNDSQIGAIHEFDGYEITVKKNDKEVTHFYRWILLMDLDKIEIEIVRKD